MNFGQLLAGAGAVGQGWREEVDARRRSRTVELNNRLLEQHERLRELEAQQLARRREMEDAETQLRLQELMRLDQLRKEMLNRQVPQLEQNFLGNLAPMPVKEVKPTATPAPAAPAPTATPTLGAPTPATTTPEGVQTFALPEATRVETRELPKKATPEEVKSIVDKLNKLRLERDGLRGPWYLPTPDKNRARLAQIEQDIAALEQEYKSRVVPAARQEYERANPQYIYPETRAAQETEIRRKQIPPGGQQVDMQKLMEAMIWVESGGKHKAVSGDGAVGLMQVLPSTAMNPGHGLPNIFDFAQQKGVKVGRRNEAEAKRLLADPKIGAEYGMTYMATMLQRYNNNLDYALAAYNAGPGRVDKWIDNKNADPNKLPKETRDYIARVKQYLSGKIPQTAKTAQAQQAAQTAQLPQAASPIIPVGLQIPGAPTKAAEVEPTDPSQFYLANPSAVTADMRRVLQQREDVVQLAKMYHDAGMGLQYMETLAKVREIDNSLLYLHGMQGLQELEFMNDPRRLSAVWSQYAGVPIGVQPRTDGRWDIYINNKLAKKGVTKEDIAEAGRSAFDATYRQQKAEASRKYNEEILKAGFEIQKENAKQLAQMIREIAVEKAKGNIEIMKKELENKGYKVQIVNENAALIITPDNWVYMFDPRGEVQKINGVDTTTYSVTPVMGPQE